MKKGFTWRKLFNDIHLWLGLASGLVLFVVCLTGTIFTFHTEIEEALEPEKYQVEVPANATALSADELITKLERQEKGKVTGLQIPAHAEKPYRLMLKKEQAGEGGPGGPGGGGRPTTYLVNQYTGEINGTTESAASEFFHTVEQLHRFLLVKAEPGTINPGKVIVGVSTIIFVFILLSGMVIWFPKKLKNWKKGLKVKTSGNWKRINHDLHNSLGFYSFGFLLVMSLTGLCWSFEWYRDGASAVLGDKIFKQRGEKPLPSDPAGATGQTMTVASMINLADQAVPYQGNYRISLPSDSTGSIVVQKTEAGFFAPSAADKVQIDQYSGKVLKVEKFSDKPFNEKVASSVRALHLGDVFGTFSKILYFLACLIATSLPITGTLIWWNKLKKKSNKKQMGARPVLTQVS
ncbi:PepSY-associated TM helix domain-containing protein [Rufibacter roseus]|uniref:PepSY-associated TM helix domain-containing protein n=1 Tax=Rufibacter roseus TaxID=1567108 RepID=A0ABW2DL01_9BACT|nr:PepSY-associated TM helix domain-containing protein [Rufibacter roseus]